MEDLLNVDNDYFDGLISKLYPELQLNKANSSKKKKGKRKVQGVPQSQTAAHPRHQEEEKTDKTKQAQIKHMYEKH